MVNPCSEIKLPKRWDHIIDSVPSWSQSFRSFRPEYHHVIDSVPSWSRSCRFDGPLPQPTVQDWIESLRNQGHDASPFKARIASEDRKSKTIVSLRNRLEMRTDQLKTVKRERDFHKALISSMSEENNSLRRRVEQLEAQITPEKGSW